MCCSRPRGPSACAPCGRAPSSGCGRARLRSPRRSASWATSTRKPRRPARPGTALRGARVPPEPVRAAIAAAPAAPAKPRILIADDDPQMRRLVRGILERDGYEITEAADGLDALAAVA